MWVWASWACPVAIAIRQPSTQDEGRNCKLTSGLVDLSPRAMLGLQFLEGLCVCAQCVHLWNQYLVGILPICSSYLFSILLLSSPCLYDSKVVPTLQVANIVCMFSAKISLRPYFVLELLKHDMFYVPCNSFVVPRYCSYVRDLCARCASAKPARPLVVKKC